MASGITFSGFNNIDFSVVLNALMAQASQPLATLQTQQSAVQARINSFTTLSSRLSALESAADDLSTAEGVESFSATSSDSTAVAVSTNGSGVTGHYDIVVKELARAQVTASTSSAASTDTVVATGGTLTIGGATIDVAATGPLTLQQLADAINAKSDSPATAAIVRTGSDQYRLVLTGKSSGTANAFTVTDQLTGAGALTFGGDAVTATDASVLVNNIQVASSSNVIDGVVPGATLTLLRKDDQTTVGVDVTRDTSALKTKINQFITSYNSFVKFASDQSTAAANGDQASIGRDPLLRQLRNTLRATLSSSYAAGGPVSYASQAGIEFTKTGTLQFNETTFDAAVQSGTTDVRNLFVGSGSGDGIFSALAGVVSAYTQASGLVPSAQQQLQQQLTHLGDQVAKMQDRLALQRQALQQEFTAADAAMSTLKSQSSSLASFGASASSN